MKNEFNLDQEIDNNDLKVAETKRIEDSSSIQSKNTPDIAAEDVKVN